MRVKLTEEEKKARQAANQARYRANNKERLVVKAAENREKTNTQSRLRYAINKEKEAARSVAKYIKNKERLAAKYIKNKEDIRAKKAAHYAKNRERIKAKERARYAENPERYAAYYAKNKERYAVWRAKNKEIGAVWRAKNKETLKAKKAMYNAENREKINSYFLVRYTEDTNFKLAHNLRKRIKDSIKIGSGKKAFRSIEMLGCSIAHVRQHLESQFLPGMTWQNYGRDGWHIDHIKPCSSFNLTDPEQQKKCFHYTNLQPLWATDNMSKGKKVDWQPQRQSAQL